MGASVTKRKKITLGDALAELITDRGMRIFLANIDKVGRKGDPTLGVLCEPKKLARKTRKKRHISS